LQHSIARKLILQVESEGLLARGVLVQGTLREALDKRRLPRLPGTSFPHPSIVFSLAHDMAAAMLHLHSEGIV
jgi:hypothetical protein